MLFVEGVPFRLLTLLCSAFPSTIITFQINKALSRLFFMYQLRIPAYVTVPFEKAEFVDKSIFLRARAMDQNVLTTPLFFLAYHFDN